MESGDSILVKVICSQFSEARVDLYTLQESSPLPSMVFLDRRSACHGYLGTQLPQGSAQVCVLPSEPDHTGAVQGQGRRTSLAGCTSLVHPDLLLRK